MRIRMAGLEDAAALLAIYAPYVRETAITFEYDVPSEKEFAGRIAHTLEKFPYLVAENDGEIVGYAYAGAFHPRAAYQWCAEMSVYVKRDARRMGVGRKLYDAMETILSMQRLTNVEACIAVPSAPDAHLTLDSVRFHEKMGYRMVGAFHQCGYKFDTWYDTGVDGEAYRGTCAHFSRRFWGLSRLKKKRERCSARLFAEPAVHDLAFFLRHTGKNAFPQSAECVVMFPQARQQTRPIHHALAERTVFPLAFAVKHAVFHVQHAVSVCRSRKAHAPKSPSVLRARRFRA